jgi:hypothetical protein
MNVHHPPDYIQLLFRVLPPPFLLRKIRLEQVPASFRIKGKGQPIYYCEHSTKFYVNSVPQFTTNSKLNLDVRFLIEGSYGSVCLQRAKPTGRFSEPIETMTGKRKLKGISVAARPCSSELAFPCSYYFTQLSDSCLRKPEHLDLFFQCLGCTITAEIAVDTGSSGGIDEIRHMREHSPGFTHEVLLMLQSVLLMVILSKIEFGIGNNHRI